MVTGDDKVMTNHRPNLNAQKFGAHKKFLSDESERVSE